ncbi:helix-turn-helix transcriptional regulator [Kordia jejudonensis]|uniref:helix-turn-helix transcriptional regulator n=1 Tax=Kordia jejudonensis TaxID=1348245 RepID=UPI000629AA71|nr:helix-turn-helix transcriptional regulator [Kordia jejudonensis]
MNILRLKEVLKEKEMTGKDLAEKVEVTPASISNIVQGNSFPKPELLLKIAQTLDVDIRELFHPTKENSTTLEDIQKAIDTLESLKKKYKES